ncbi:MAG: LysM peptidoglycan-binding domain-containing protein [Gammaproteobacteria bacterium]
MNPDTELFARMRQGFRLDHRLSEPRVQAQARWFEKNPAYLDRVFDRGSKYLYHIVESLETSGLPLEIALLPLVESAFDPFAYSHGRASGLWQFIPGTARLQGLTIDWWFDGRRDVLYSTKAAIDYLSMLNRQFKGDWELTLAAYNGGIGNVRKSIRRRGNHGNAADFWTLDLAKETEAYVPKLLAIAALVADPGAFNYELPSIANEPVFDEVDIGHQIDLALAAQLAMLDVETLYRFNPGLNQWATHPDGPHRLIVPIGATQTFRENLMTLSPTSRIAWERYKVKSGDTLSEIADRFNVSTQVLMRQNDLNTSRIRAGQALLIPKAIGPESSLTANGRLASRQRRLADDPDRSHISYTVRPGDSLWTIARKYGTTTKAIARWNQIGEKSMLQIGQALQLYPKKARALRTVTSPRPSLQKVERTIRYTVKPGDSFGRIANRFQVSIANLKRWNPEHAKEKYLQPGDRLVIKINVKQLTQ